jgi:hypothetical protein
MGKSRVQTRVEPDTQEQIQAYQDEKDIGQAEALRRLIKTGLATEGHPVDESDSGGTPLDRLSKRLIGLATMLLTIGAIGLVLTPAPQTALFYGVAGVLCLGVLSLYLSLIALLAVTDSLTESVTGYLRGDAA